MVEFERGSNPPEKILPELIQGGMGVGVSSWELARSVAIAGEKLDQRVLGVVSGTGLPIIMVDRLQKRDPATIRALEAFGKVSDPAISKEILDEYLPNDDVLPGKRFKLPPKPEVLVTGSDEIKAKFNKIAVAAAFVEVWLAKEGHSQPIGINILEKVQLMHLPTILGAMMAGVDTVLVGAGIPHQIPQVLKDFADGKEATYKLDIGNSKEKIELKLDPKDFIHNETKLKMPNFYAIISHHLLAMMLSKKEGVDGFVVEGPLAGGHNAPARGKKVDELGQPVYGERDEPDLDIILKTGKPFWLAGSYAGRLDEAHKKGAAGVQVGSAFALSKESGLTHENKERMREMIMGEELKVITSPIASPTGFPIQLAQLPGSLTDEDVYEERKRVCSLGYLVKALIDKKGNVEFLCSAEPVKAFARKGGDIEETHGRMCLCNGLATAAGHGQIGEPQVLTLGKDLGPINEILKIYGNDYSAKHVVGYVFSH